MAASDEDTPGGAASADVPPADPIADEVYCPNCAYNLHLCASQRCPECGYALAALRSPVCQIPWAQRADRGRFRTYWQTVWAVIARHRDLCEEMGRPVSFSDAQAFRWVTVLHAFLPIALAVVVAYLARAPTLPPILGPVERMMRQVTGPLPIPANPTFIDRALVEVWPAGLLLCCLPLLLAAATGVPSYLFHPRGVSVGQQNKTVALSYYACAPLALTGLAAVFAVATVIWPDAWPVEVGLAAAVCCVAFLLCAWLILLANIARRTMPHLRGRPVLVAFGVSVLWLAAAGVTLAGLPAMVLYVIVVVYSLL